MDGLALLRAADAAGLTVNIDGDRLVIRGPRSADATARALLEHKPEVMAALAGPADASRSNSRIIFSRFSISDCVWSCFKVCSTSLNKRFKRSSTSETVWPTPFVRSFELLSWLCQSKPAIDAFVTPASVSR